MRQRSLRVGARLERAALALSQPLAAAPQAGSIALGIDAGHVRSVRSYQVCSFEVLWRLWNGQVRRALDLIGETLARLEGMADAARTVAAKVAALLRGLETYVSGQAS